MATFNPQVPGIVSETYSPDRLIAGMAIRIVTDAAVLVSGQNLTRGAVLGKITTGGKLTLSLTASSDGSQTPYAILAEDTNASAADKTCTVYLAGEFNPNVMTFGTGHSATTATTVAALRDGGIYLKSYISA